MAEHHQRGQEGEAKALEYLKESGFKIIELNWRVHHLEVDIIAEKNNVLHFIEVKTRKENSLIPARESLSYKKKQNLIRAVELWFYQNPHSQQSAQLDFIALTYNSKGEHQIEYFPNYTE